MSLVHGDLEEQAVLEAILEENKPLLPPEAAGLHWLLATPFRYRPLPAGSRFRGRTDPGVFYAAEDRKTACAESGYWRLQFWMDSEGLAEQSTSLRLALFKCHAATTRAVDLSQAPFVRDRAAWVHPSDYRETQALARNAREAGVEVIRYESVRNSGGFCLALLAPVVFKSVSEPYRNEQQTWTLLIEPPDLTVWQREIFRESWSFRF